MALLTFPTNEYGGDGLTVASLLERHASGIAELLSGDVSSAPAIVDCEFFDAEALEHMTAGILLLVPSWTGLTDNAARELARLASERQVSGVVVFTTEPKRAIATLGSMLNQTPLLNLTGRVTWRQFEGIVLQAIGERSPGIAQAPMHPDYLYSLADSVAEAFGGAVSIENHARTLLAYSTIPGQLIDNFRERGVLTRQVPEVERNRTQYSIVLRATDPVRFPQYDEELPRAAIAIRAGSLHLGTIWAIDPNGFDASRPLPTAQQTILQRAAELAAAHLIAGWRLADEDAYQRQQSLAQAIRGNEHDLFRDMSTKFPLFLVGARFTHQVASLGDLAQLRLVIDRELRARLTLIASVVEVDVSYFLVPAESQSTLIQAITAALNAAKRVFHASIQAAVSSAAASEDLMSLRSEVDLVFHAAKGVTTKQVFAASDVRDRLLVDAVGELLQQRPYLKHPELGDLKPQLRETLLALFAHDGNIQAAAEQLQVHPNTVRYRRNLVWQQWPQAAGSAAGSFAMWATLLADQSPTASPDGAYSDN